MNIKAKLIKQLEVLENLQTLSIESGAFDTALRTSGTILEYIQNIDGFDDDGEEDLKDEFICPECQEEIMKQSLYGDIAKACNMPIEVVDLVMAGQENVLGTY